MNWEHKGIRFQVTIEALGPFYLASARAPSEGPFIRVRPFSALGRTKGESLQLLESQIAMEYRKVPDFVSRETG
ncbi:MAG: hypothetical protein ACE5JX_07935 [Acidobacteriota bacterium]